MVLKNLLLPLASVLLLAAAPVFAQRVSVQVLDDNGSVFRTYPVNSQQPNSFRAYLEAKRDVRYGIRVRNNTNQRVGLIIAVDGRNIISGEKSYLGSAERKYILNPHAEATHRGWRSDRDSVQRFYFTDEGDSYAGAWGDGSAMGVIAVAVYAEQAQEIIISEDSDRLTPLVEQAQAAMAQDRPAPPAGTGYGERASSQSQQQQQAAGTGYGEHERSISKRVNDFTPETQAMEKHFYKYEWYESLCQKRVIDCQPEQSSRENRMWDDNGYAPPPPRR